MNNTRTFLRTFSVIFLVWYLGTILQADSADPHRLKALIARPHLIDTAQVNACYELARYYLYDSTEQAKKYAMKGIEMASLLDFPAGRGRCQGMFAMSFEILGKVDDALEIYEDAFLSLSEAGLVNDAAGILVNMGVAHYYAGNRSESLKYYLRALAYIQANQLREQEAKLLNSMAVLYEELKQYPDAIQMYRQSLQIILALEDSLNYAQTLENLGLVYSYTRDGENAVQYLDQAIACYRSLGRDTEAVQARLSLASIFIQVGKLSASEEILTELLADLEVNLLPHYKASCYLMLARIKLERSEDDQALSFLDQGYIFIENSNRDELKSGYLALYAEIYRKQGSYQKALEYTTYRMAILDTLYQKDRIETEREMNAKFDLQQKEARLIIQEQKIMQQMRERRWFAALLLISVSLIVVLTFFAMSKVRSNKILLVKNQIIDKSLREKDVLLREIHHRVNNNLQVVSSLLSLQARSLKGQEALDALTKGKDRVKSMALIHQNLYQEEHLTGVNSKEYIDRLGRSLLASYSLGQDKIKLKTDVEPLLLDIDTVIPLGLILNELITNAMKYAFKPDRVGEISISLCRNQDALEMVVSDNGIGMPADSFISTQTMGYRLIKSFVQKLKGTYQITVDHGTRVAFSFRAFQLAKAS